jgi:hypothetical protein
MCSKGMGILVGADAPGPFPLFPTLIGEVASGSACACQAGTEPTSIKEIGVVVASNCQGQARNGGIAHNVRQRACEGAVDAFIKSLPGIAANSIGEIYDAGDYHERLTVLKRS